MTGYTVHTGSNDKFRDGWDSIFGGKKQKQSASSKKSAKGKASGAKKAKSAKKKSKKK